MGVSTEVAKCSGSGGMWRKGWKRKTDEDFVGKDEAPHSRKFPKRDSDDGGVADGITVCQVMILRFLKP